MRLDYNDGQSVFYDRITYERDSLKNMAFEDGKIVNQEEYDKMRSLPRPRLDEMVILNFKTAEAVFFYKQATLTIRGTSDIVLPDWELSDEAKIIGGFNCKKASANYMGRSWTAWYTEEIPLPIGPWILWGAPGLIVAAQDSDGCFDFQLLWTDVLDYDGRAAFIDSFFPKESSQRGVSKHFVLPLKEASQMNYRMQKDPAYVLEVAGARTKNMDQLRKKEIKYIPLIPNEYWKDK